MKTLLLSLILTVSGLAAEPVVKISIAVEGKPTVEATVTPEAVAAMRQFIAEVKKEDGTPKYLSLAELLILHVRESLIVPLVQRYPPAAVATVLQQVDAAKAAVDAATVAAAAGTVVVK